MPSILPRGLKNIELPAFSSPESNVQASPIAAQRSSLEERRRPAAKFDHAITPGTDRIEEEDLEDDAGEGEEEELYEYHGEDDAGELSPLLPIFSAAHLDALPVYNITHTMRLLIAPRCETTLSWDQLRSPQVSQFLLKPIQQEIRTSHFSKATLYALLANCLQFNKEGATHPGNSGTSKTRALVCELLAIKLLKEFSTRELIGDESPTPSSLPILTLGLDALSYDFYPLQGLPSSSSGVLTPGPNWGTQKEKPQARAARISTLEIAIRAQSKRFLAHPLVVQQLEAIWAGTIVFHSAADSLHRTPEKVIPNQNRGYGAIVDQVPVLQASADRLQPAKQRDHLEPVTIAIRRSASLYDPREASLFKLSRLRVPRYRQFLSTGSFAILLGLYVAVLVERSLNITALELVFWFWSAGFMLDEVVGFNEQGFSLYILSFWNSFDLGILLLLVCYYTMRLYGMLMPDSGKHQVADTAYDLLAANAVLLFPRLFSVLDHYRYFSQLLIAFRMMAMDLVAVFVLIVILCSGFFVAFTLSFGTGGYDAASVAYALFQMLMGFTPAAWESWGTYNLLGKAILTLFLFICHFLIVTILITVLTNSFMAIVQNANEEHQFVFAVNTISMVKSDALFSYIAPTNVIAWILTPLRFILPFRLFVKMNRTVIKATHFPVLFVIFAYERLILRGSLFEPIDLVENRGRQGLEMRAFEAPGAGLNLFSPKQQRLREPSVATHHKDRALDEVFRRPFTDKTMRNTQMSTDRRETSNVVNNWMQNMGPNGIASPPIEQDRSVVEKLEARRLARRRSQIAIRRRQPRRGRDLTEATMSIVSDPEDFILGGHPTKEGFVRENSDLPSTNLYDIRRQIDADGDDELMTNDEDELMTTDRPTATPNEKNQMSRSSRQGQDDYFHRTPNNKSRTQHSPSMAASRARPSPPKQVVAVRTTIQRPSRVGHIRNTSTNTIVYDPPPPEDNTSTSSPSRKAITARNSAKNTGTATPVSVGRRTPKRPLPGAARPRPIMPPHNAFQSAPDLAGMFTFDDPRRRPHNLTMDLGSDIGDNKAMGGGYVGAIPNSFATQMAFATGAMRAGHAVVGENDDQQRMSKLMLARMNALDEGFREVLQEVKDMRKDGNRSAGDDDHRGMKIVRIKPKKSNKREGKMKSRKGIEEEDWIDDPDMAKEGRSSI